MSANDSHLTSKINLIHQALLQAYGAPQPVDAEPVATLVNTILSQNTNDGLRDKAFDRLRLRFPTWEQVRDAPLEQVIEAIQTAGLAQQKGRHIQTALRRITAERGELALDFLADWPLEQARAWLMAMPGVGPKTAAIVLLFALGRPAFPVDTHIQRVSTRLGLIPAKTSAEKAHTRLEALIPPAWYYPFHLNLITHGRRVCAARRPHCEACRLQAQCDYFQATPQPAAGDEPKKD